MKRLLIILMLSVIVTVGCGGDKGDGETAVTQSTPADDAYQAMRKERKVMDSPEDRVAITKKFLEEFVESDHTASSLDAIFYYQGTEMDDQAGALKYAETVRAKITDPAVALAVDKILIGFYAETGAAARMKVLADRLAAAGALNFNDHWNVVEGAVKAGEWELVRDYCVKARQFADAEALKAEDPDREYADGEIEKIVQERLGMLMVKDNWARANQGQVDEALAAYAEADKMVPRYYFDVPEYDLFVYWGNTLLKKGDYDGAIERFAFNALVMQNEDALAGLKEAYARKAGNANDYEAWAHKLHLSVAPTQDDFEMADYDGKRHRFSDIRGDVTLLSLWFPT